MDITKIKSNVTISAVVTRANGKIEDHGIICGQDNGEIRINDETMQSVLEDLEITVTNNEEGV